MIMKLIFMVGASNIVSFYSYTNSWLFDFVMSILFGVLLFLCLMIFFYFIYSGGSIYMDKNLKVLEYWFCLVPGILILLIFFFSSFTSDTTFFLGDSYQETFFWVEGSQWYWSLGLYNVEECFSLVYNMESVSLGGLRLGEIINHLEVPTDQVVTFCFFSSDVIHSWFLPSGGIKVDLLPGLYTSMSMNFCFVGWFVGSCAEFCGVGHSLMPFILEVVPCEIFFI